jgi:hypothetical protein
MTQTGFKKVIPSLRSSSNARAELQEKFERMEMEREREVTKMRDELVLLNDFKVWVYFFGLVEGQEARN